jgi:hypothetical protein
MGSASNRDWANRRLRKLDQCFINPSLGLAQTEPEKRHVLFSLADDNTYAASLMAAVNQKVCMCSPWCHLKINKLKLGGNEDGTDYSNAIWICQGKF